MLDITGVPQIGETQQPLLATYPRRDRTRRSSNSGKRAPGRDDDTRAKEDMLEADWEEQPRHQEMLYDLYFDPDQRNNLIDEPEMKEVVQDLRDQLDLWMRETEDPLLHGAAPLPKGVKTTDPDAFSPRTEPFIVGE